MSILDLWVIFLLCENILFIYTFCSTITNITSFITITPLAITLLFNSIPLEKVGTVIQK